MKKYLWLLILLTPFLFAGSIQQRHMAVLSQYNAAVAVSDSADFTEDMTGTFATDWGDPIAAGTAQYASDQWDPTTDTTDNAGVYQTGDTNSVKHWAKSTLINADHSGDASGVILRSADTSATGNSYAVACEVTSATLKVFRLSGGAWQEDIDETNFSHTCTDNDVIAGSVELTGTNTVIRGWVNPDGAADSGPSAWGAADSTWDCNAGGCSNLSGGEYADSGEYVGIYNYDDENILDDWYAGDW